MVRPAITILVLISAAVLCSCGAILGSPLEVVSWSPGGDVATPTDISEISLSFNRGPEPVCTERAFSITADGAQPPGRATVSGCVLTFVPYYPLDDHTDYEIKLTTSAGDRHGNSLFEDFRVSFRIGGNGTRPEVVSTSPADGETTDDRQAPVTITFDRPVDYDSVLSAFSISPSVAGVAELDSEQTVFTFTPAERWKWQKEYTAELSTDLESVCGCALAEDYLFSFSVGTDSTAPEIISAGADDGSVLLTESPSDGASMRVNTGWEKDRGVRFVFSEAVGPDSAESAVTIEPDAPFRVEFDNAAAPVEMTVSFEENLLWHELYRLAVSTGLSDLQDNCLEDEHIYYIYIDGPASLPPAVSRVELSPGGGTGFCIFDSAAPASAVSNHLILDTSGGDASANPYFIDYYFTLADGAELPFFGFVENYLISPDDSCVSFAYLDFQIFNPGDSLATAASPAPAPDASQGVMRLITSMTDTSTQSGLILFQVYADLTDSLGNRMIEDWTAELFDEDS